MNIPSFSSDEKNEEVIYMISRVLDYTSEELNRALDDFLASKELGTDSGYASDDDLAGLVAYSVSDDSEFTTSLAERYAAHCSTSTMSDLKSDTSSDIMPIVPIAERPTARCPMPAVSDLESSNSDFDSRPTTPFVLSRYDTKVRNRRSFTVSRTSHYSFVEEHGERSKILGKGRSESI